MGQIATFKSEIPGDYVMRRPFVFNLFQLDDLFNTINPAAVTEAADHLPTRLAPLTVN